MLRLTLTLALSACLALVASGCGDDHDDPLALERDACTHFVDGPIKAITAGTDAASAADATGEHTRFDITLVDRGDGTFGGFVSIAIGDAGDHAIFLSAAATVTLRDATGAVVAAESTSGPSTVCQTIAAGHVFDLGVGSYTLELAGATAAAIQVVYLEADDADDH